MTKGVEAVETWIGWLNDEDLEYETAPCQADKYYKAMNITMCMIAMEALGNPPREMLDYTEERIKNFSEFYFHEDDNPAIDYLRDFREQWRPNVVPMWKDEGFVPKSEIDEEDKENAKFHHLTTLKSQFDRMKRLALGQPVRVFRPDSHPIPMRKDDSPDWLDELILIYEEEEEEGSEPEMEERKNQEEFQKET